MKRHRSRRSIRKLCRFFVIGMIILLSRPMAIYPQGFGVIKKDVHFSRLRLPKIFINSFDVAVRVNSFARSTDLSASDFQSKLESQIASGNQQINLNPQRPKIVIACQLSDVNRTEIWTKKYETQRQKVGQKEVWNEKKQKMEKKDNYEDVKVEVPYLRVSWKASITFRIYEVATAKVLASDRDSFYHSNEYKEGKGALDSVPGIQDWANRTALQIAAYVVPTREQVRILLPKGKLDRISDKIEERKLAEALQELEDMPALKKPEDEAYKFYILGACYEAMAYQNDKTDLLDQYLEQGAKNYAKALDIKPDEKYFREAQERLQTSVANYKELNERYYAAQKTPKESKPKEPLATPSPTSLSVTGSRSASSANSLAPPKTEPKTATESKPSPPSKSTPEAKATETLTNETIVRMVKAGLSEENILATINETQAVSFDPSPNAQLQLIQAGVTNRLINAMRNVKKSK
jgi:hypothetical protein